VLGQWTDRFATKVEAARRGVTQRHYIRRPVGALVAAADRVAARIAAAMQGKPGGEVVPLRRG